jgi:hypothetical protein
MHPSGANAKIVAVRTGLNCEGEPQPSVTMLELASPNHCPTSAKPWIRVLGVDSRCKGQYFWGLLLRERQGSPRDFYATIATSSLAHCSRELQFASSGRSLLHPYLILCFCRFSPSRALPSIEPAKHLSYASTHRRRPRSSMFGISIIRSQRGRLKS